MFWGNLAGEDTPAGKAMSYLFNEPEEVSEVDIASSSRQEIASQQGLTGVESSEAKAPEVEPSEARLSEIESLTVYELPSDNDVLAVSGSIDSEMQTQSVEKQPVEKIAEESIENNNFTVSAAGNRGAEPAVIEIKSENREEGGSIEQQQVSSSHDYKQYDNTMHVKREAAEIVQAALESSAEVVTTNIQSKSAVNTVQASINNETRDTFVSAQVEQQLLDLNRRGRVINPSQQNDAIRASWNKARKSFYLRDFALSEKKYQYIIDNTEDNYDIFGELGNVYFYQGKTAQAAAAYYEAAVILVRKGQIRRAESLINLLRTLDKAKAVELQKIIDDSHEP